MSKDEPTRKDFAESLAYICRELGIEYTMTRYVGERVMYINGDPSTAVILNEYAIGYRNHWTMWHAMFGLDYAGCDGVRIKEPIELVLSIMAKQGEQWLQQY